MLKASEMVHQLFTNNDWHSYFLEEESWAIFFFFFLILATMQGMWDLSSLTRDRTHPPPAMEVQSYPLDHQPSPKLSNFAWEHPVTKGHSHEAKSPKPKIRKTPLLQPQTVVGDTQDNNEFANVWKTTDATTPGSRWLGISMCQMLTTYYHTKSLRDNNSKETFFHLFTFYR